VVHCMSLINVLAVSQNSCNISNRFPFFLATDLTGVFLHISMFRSAWTSKLSEDLG
jgi:hypothetical protein